MIIAYTRLFGKKEEMGGTRLAAHPLPCGFGQYVEAYAKDGYPVSFSEWLKTQDE